MSKSEREYLSKRLQQIMDLAYQRGQVTASELEEILPGKPSNSTVRTQLRTLEDRGYLKRPDEGKYVYVPTKAKPSAAKAAMQRFLETFVDGSLEQALATLLSAKEQKLTDEELDRLRKMIDEAKGDIN